MATKMKKYQDDGGKKTKKSSKSNSRTQVTANGKTRTVTTNEKGKTNYIHTGGSKKVGSDTYFTGKNDKYYYANKSGNVEYSQPGFSKDVDTTGYAAGKKEFNLNTNLINPSGKKTTTSTKVSRSQVQPMLNRWQSTASKMKTGGMVNANTSVKKQTVPGSKGVMSGENPKASASKVAKGRSGGTSKAPKTAVPKAQMGGMAGGIPISERAAARKVKKGKGAITKSYPSGPEEKGSYVGFSKEARKSNSPFKSMKDSKPARPIRKKGGAMKKGY